MKQLGLFEGIGGDGLRQVVVFSQNKFVMTSLSIEKCQNQIAINL
jgi:hypothetical protein